MLPATIRDLRLFIYYIYITSITAAQQSISLILSTPVEDYGKLIDCWAAASVANAVRALNAGVFVNGGKAPIIGRVSMDQFVVDLGPNSLAKSGDWVIIFGDGSRGEYTADDWGAASSSINYEIVTRIGPRVPRIYAHHD